MSRATSETVDAHSKEISSWNWKSTIQGAVRRVNESVASSHPPWIPDNTCTAAIGVLFEALQHDRDSVLDSLLNGLKSIELPASLSTMDSRLCLHQALCMTRVISSCVFHDWLSYQTEEILSTPFGAWKDPPRLADATVRQFVSTVSKHLVQLVGYRELSISEQVDGHSSSFKDLDKLRSFTFLSRDTNSNVREYDCLYAMLDAHLGVYTASASPDAYYVLDAHFPPYRAPFKLTPHGVFYTATLWHTPADALDASEHTVAAYLYRELAYLMLFTSSTHWELTVQCVGSLTDARTNVCLYECMHWRWPQLEAFMRQIIRELPQIPRSNFVKVAVMLRRVVHMWTHFHDDERHVMCLNGMPDAASQLFDTLFAQADSLSRRIVLWPTLGALLGLSPAPYTPARVWRDVHSKKWVFSDSLYHNLSNSRLGFAAWFSVIIMHSVSETGGPSIPAALTSGACSRLLEQLHSFTANDARLGGLLLASQIRLGNMEEAMNLVHACLYARPCNAGVLVVVHALLLLIIRDIGSWRAVLYPPCAPVLRRWIRSGVRAWCVDKALDDMTMTAIHGILYVALLDPLSVLTLLPNEPLDQLQLPRAPSTAQLDTLLQKDSRVSLVLAFLHVPMARMRLLAASNAVIMRLSGDKPNVGVLSHFPYVPITLLEQPSTPTPDMACILQMLGPIDIDVATNAVQHVMVATSESDQLYWLIALQTSVSCLLRLQISVERKMGPAAVLYGLFMPSVLTVQAALDATMLLSHLYPLPEPLPTLAKSRPNLSTLCHVLRNTPVPNHFTQMAWSALLRLWLTCLPKSRTNRISKSDLSHMVQILAAGAHIGLHGVTITSDTPFVKMVSDMLLHYPDLHDLAFVLVDAVPAPILPHIILLAHTELPRSESHALWLRLLKECVPRLSIDTVSAATLRAIVDMLLACAMSVTTISSRSTVCEVTAILAPCERPEMLHARAQLVDWILPWTIGDGSLRQKALECIVHMCQGLTDDIPSLVLRIDVSREVALFRRTSRIVDRLIRAATVGKLLDAGAQDVSLAVVALEHVLRQNLDFLSHEAVTLTTSPLPSARMALMLAMARLFSHPDYKTLENVVEPPKMQIQDALFFDEGHWIARLICSGSIHHAQLMEKVLTGTCTTDKMHAILQRVLQTKVDASTRDLLWLRTNSAALIFLTAYARRFTHVHIQSIVQSLVTAVSQSPLEGFDSTSTTDQSDERLRAQHEREIQLITLLGEKLEEFACVFPIEMHWLSTRLYQAIARRFGDETASFSLGTFLCLRLLGPAIAAPESVAVEPPQNQAARRALVFLNKVLVALPQGGFPVHREPRLTTLNDVILQRNVFLRRILQESVRYDVQSNNVNMPSELIPQPICRELRQHMQELASNGDENASTLLQILPAHPSLRERFDTALCGESRDTVFKSFMDMYSAYDTRTLSNLCVVRHGEEYSTFCIFYSRLDLIRGDFTTLSYYLCNVASKFTRPWILILDMTGSTEKMLFQNQYTAFVSAILPAKAFRHLHSIVIVNGGLALLRHGWMVTEQPYENGYIARRQIDGGPPLKLDWVTSAEEFHAQHKDVQLSLSPASTRLFFAKPSYVLTVVSYDDGFCTPVSATLILLNDCMLIRSKPMPHHGGPIKPPRSCDIIPLSDIVLTSDHVSRMCIRRYSCPDLLFLNTRHCEDLGHQLYSLRMASGDYAHGLYAPVTRSSIRAVFVGMGLFYRTSTDVPMRFAADTLLRAAGVFNQEMQPMFIPPNLPFIDVPVPLRSTALHTALGITACLGRQHVLFTRAEQLLMSVPYEQLPRILHLGLVLWMTHPELRTALLPALSLLRTLSSTACELFLDVCVDLTPMCMSPVMNAIQDAIMTSSIPHLLDIILSRLHKTFLSPRSPGLLHKVHALVALLAVQCLVPDTPLRAHVPEVLCILLLFYQDPLPSFHSVSSMSFVHTLVMWPAPELASLASDKLKSTLSILSLVELVNKVVFTLAANSEQCAQWTLAIEHQIQNIALSPGSLMQSRALQVLGHLCNASQSIMHRLGLVLLESFPHAPVTADAAAMCLSRVFLPTQAPMLFWAGMILITAGVHSGGLRLCSAALDALDSHAFADIMEARRRFATDATALDEALGVSFERDFSFACASLLRQPLWDGHPVIQGMTRTLIERLNALVPDETATGDNKNISGLLLLLYLFDPSITDTSQLPPQYFPFKNDDKMSKGKILSAALARSFLPRASDSQLHLMLPLLSDGQVHAVRKSDESLLPGNNTSPLSQLGFSGLKFDIGSGQYVSECRAWLQHIVEQWA